MNELLHRGTGLGRRTRLRLGRMGMRWRLPGLRYPGYQIKGRISGGRPLIFVRPVTKSIRVHPPFVQNAAWGKGNAP